MGDRLLKGEKLERGQALTSRNGAYTLTLQDDGNLVLAARGQALWATGTNGQDVVRAEVQTDEPPPPPPVTESAEPQVVPAAVEETAPAPPEPEAAAAPPPPPPPPPPAPRTYNRT